MFFRKKNALSVEDMVEMEKWLEDECIPTIGNNVSESIVSEKLKLKVEYTSPSNLAPHVEAELRPIDDSEYNGLIRVNTDLMGKTFAYLHEIIHYLRDVGIGNKVDKVFTRKAQGHTESVHEQKINYATAAYIIPYNEIEQSIREYDASRPKMDELEFVNSFCNRYNQSRDVVIRRIQEVRRIRRSKAKRG